MNNRALTLSLVMAVLAVFFVNSYVTSIEDEAKKKFGTEILVVKAKRDIKEAETVNETVLKFERVPKRFLEPAAISFDPSESGMSSEDREKEQNRRLKALTGTVAVVPIKAGEQITFNKLTDPGIRTGLAPQVAPGKRAMTLPVNEMTGVGKLVKPGDRVDIIAIIDKGAGKENRLAKTILQDVVILATGHYVTNNTARTVEADPINGKEKVHSLAEDSSFGSVTLELEPMQAEALALVMATGDVPLTLSLRNNDDNDRVNVGSLMIDDILGPDAARIQRRPTGR